MTEKQQGWIWIVGVFSGYLTIAFELEEIASVGFLFLNVGLMTISFLLDKIHKLENPYPYN